MLGNVIVAVANVWQALLFELSVEPSVDVGQGESLRVTLAYLVSLLCCIIEGDRIPRCLHLCSRPSQNILENPKEYVRDDRWSTATD